MHAQLRSIVTTAILHNFFSRTYAKHTHTHTHIHTYTHTLTRGFFFTYVYPINILGMHFTLMFYFMKWYLNVLLTTGSETVTLP